MLSMQSIQTKTTRHFSFKRVAYGIGISLIAVSSILGIGPMGSPRVDAFSITKCQQDGYSYRFQLSSRGSDNYTYNYVDLYTKVKDNTKLGCIYAWKSTRSPWKNQTMSVRVTVIGKYTKSISTKNSSLILKFNGPLDSHITEKDKIGSSGWSSTTTSW